MYYYYWNLFLFLAGVSAAWSHSPEPTGPDSVLSFGTSAGPTGLPPTGPDATIPSMSTATAQPTAYGSGEVLTDSSGYPSWTGNSFGYGSDMNAYMSTFQAQNQHYYSSGAVQSYGNSLPAVQTGPAQNSSEQSWKFQVL